MDYIQLSLFSRMSPEPIPQTTAMISEPCWRNYQDVSSRNVQFLDLRKNGNTAGLSPLMGGQSHGGSWTRSSGECRSEESAYVPCFTSMNTGEAPLEPIITKLSWILELYDVPEKYSLSVKACLGILNRASRRGKELPAILRKALESVIHSKCEKDALGGQRPPDPRGSKRNACNASDADAFLIDRNSQ